MNLYDGLDEMNSELQKIDELLVDDGVEGISHTSYADDIEYTSDMLAKMLAYTGELSINALSLIDDPLCKNFNLHATEDISRIKVEDYTTPNTIGVQIAYVHADESEDIDTPETLSIEDFLGITSPENGGRLRNVPKEFSDFTNQYVQIYEALKDSLVDEKGNQISLKDYLKDLESLGEFSHTKDQPFKQFLSALLDITIVVPLYEMCTGEDFITQEDLSDFERGMKGVSAVVGLFTLGQSEIWGMPLKEGLISFGKYVAVDAASTTVSYWTGYACNEMGLPLPLTIIFSTAAGMGTSYGMNKVLFGDTTRVVVTDSGDADTVLKTMTTEEAEQFAFDAIKGPDSADSIVLGKYEKNSPNSYDAVARDMDAQYFNLDNWDDISSQYSPDEIWKINERFLDIQTSSGREIYLSHNPNADWGASYYTREINYLKENGYRFVKEGDIWHAIR